MSVNYNCSHNIYCELYEIVYITRTPYKCYGKRPCITKCYDTRSKGYCINADNGYKQTDSPDKPNTHKDRDDTWGREKKIGEPRISRKNCGSFSMCSEATIFYMLWHYYLDGDGDGIPCETLCNQ